MRLSWKNEFPQGGGENNQKRGEGGLIIDFSLIIEK